MNWCPLMGLWIVSAVIIAALLWPQPKCPRCGQRRTMRQSALGLDPAFTIYCFDCGDFVDTRELRR